MTTTTRSVAKKQEETSKASSAEDAQSGSKRKTHERTGSPRPKRTKKDEKEKRAAEKPAASDEIRPKQEIDAHKDGKGPAQKLSDEKDDTKLVPSSILEKGIIYFFFRGRVDITAPSSVDEIARSHIILRPIAKDAKLGTRPISDAGNTRLCLIPKKTLPRTGGERWTALVQKSGASFQTLKDEFLASSEYETKTAGARHTPAATPVGEGVYAITSTGRESHLVYLLTLPEELGEVQRDMGLKERGSFIIATKNPEYPGPASARLPKGPEYPKELLEEFHSLRWVPTQPKHLDFVNTQFLLVGESSGVTKALELQEEDAKQGVAEPAEEMEKLEDEDVRRMKGLGKDDSARVFADLQVHAGDYPKLKTTF